MTDSTGSDCFSWVLADSGNLALNFKVHYTDIRVNSIRQSLNGSLVKTIGSTVDSPSEKTSYMMNLDPPYVTFYGLFGYAHEEGHLSGFGSISYNRKDFDDNLVFLIETNSHMAKLKATLKVLEAAIDNAAVA